MRPLRILAAGLLITSLAGIGCDQTPSPPKAVMQAQAESPTLPGERPTTQELLSGPYKKFVFPDMPLSVMAPESWKFSTAAHLQFLEGPTPRDQAVIQFARREAVPEEQIEALVARLKGESDSSMPLHKAEIRQVGSMRILERMSTAKPITSPRLDIDGRPVMDEQGKPITITTTTVNWSLIAFVPHGKAWNRFELNLIGLTTDQLEADRPLLEKVLGSLRLEE